MPSKPHLILAPQAKHSEEERPQGRLSRLPYRPTLLVRERASSLLTRWHNHFFSLNHQSHPPDHPIHASIDIQKTHNRQALPWAPPQSLPAEFNRHPLPPLYQSHSSTHPLHHRNGLAYNSRGPSWAYCCPCARAYYPGQRLDLSRPIQRCLILHHPPAKTLRPGPHKVGVCSKTLTSTAVTYNVKRDKRSGSSKSVAIISGAVGEPFRGEEPRWIKPMWAI